MSKNGRAINYNVRPAKSVERKMILESAKDFYKNHDISKVRYVGFGSYYFTDFKLFHKELGINDMLSFEGDIDSEKRIEFNKPYGCVKIAMGASSMLLPKLDWRKGRTDFIWMDYTSTLNKDIVNDCETIFKKINPGSIYLMSCNKQLLNDYKNLESLRSTFPDLVPIDTQEKDLSGNNYADLKLVRKIFLNQIQITLDARNIIYPKKEQLVFYPIYLFFYRDGAPMMSFGGIVETKSFNKSLINQLVRKYFYLSSSDIPYHIETPNLTYREIQHLNSHLPSSKKKVVAAKAIDFIPESDKLRYRELYKYLPNYMDVIW